MTERTIRNWEAGRSQTPYAAFKLLRLMSGQEMIDPVWKGWTMVKGVLYSPANQGFKKTDMEYLWLVFRLAEQFRKEHKIGR